MRFLPFLHTNLRVLNLLIISMIFYSWWSPWKIHHVTQQLKSSKKHLFDKNLQIKRKLLVKKLKHFQIFIRFFGHFFGTFLCIHFPIVMAKWSFNCFFNSLRFFARKWQLAFSNFTIQIIQHYLLDTLK